MINGGDNYSDVGGTCRTGAGIACIERRVATPSPHLKMQRATPAIHIAVLVLREALFGDETVDVRAAKVPNRANGGFHLRRKSKARCPFVPEKQTSSGRWRRVGINLWLMLRQVWPEGLRDPDCGMGSTRNPGTLLSTPAILTFSAAPAAKRGSTAILSDTPAREPAQERSRKATRMWIATHTCILPRLPQELWRRIDQRLTIVAR